MKQRDKRKRKKSIKKAIILLSIGIFILTLLTACSGQADKITAADEQSVLFVVRTCYWDSDMESISAIDNQGNVYQMVTEDYYLDMLETGEIFNAEVVGTNDEVISFYNKLRKVDTQAQTIYLDTNNYPEAPDIYYYGILYYEGEIKPVELYYYGGSHTMLEDAHTEEIVEWMDSWN